MYDKMKYYYKKYTSVIIGIFITAFSFNLFFAPTKIIYGGTTGIALGIEDVFNTNLQTTIAVLYGIFLLIGFMFLTKKTLSKAIAGSVLYPLAIHITRNVTEYITIDYTRDLFLIYTFGAIIMGFGFGLIYKKGFSSGGLDIIKVILNQKFGISMGKTTMLINTVIVLFGASITNSYDNIMYAVIILYIIGFVTDRIILGISEQKVFQIVTTKEEELKRYIISELGHNVTIFNAKGGYANKKENIMLCVIPTKEYFIVKEAINEIDKDAFFVVSDAYESMGGR